MLQLSDRSPNNLREPADDEPAEEAEPAEQAEPPPPLQEDFDAGLTFGKSLLARFTSPVIDDPGLPSADVLVVICATLALSSLALSAPAGVPRPGWLAPLAGAPAWRGLPYIVPAFVHGTGLALCWVPGALAAEAFAAEAYMGTLGEAVHPNPNPNPNPNPKGACIHGHAGRGGTP